MNRTSSSPWLLWTLALVLLASLPVLGWLQYHWLGQLHAAESQRLAAGLESGLEHFARDFDREMGDLFVVFQTPGPQLAKAYESWADQTAFPGLLREVWTASFISPTSLGPPTQESWSRFVPDASLEPASLEPASLPAEIAEIVSRAAAPGTLIIEPLDDERWVLLVPQPPSLFSMAPSLASRGQVATLTSEFVLFESFPSPNVIVLDRHYAISEMVGRLATLHFPSTAEGFDYAVLRSRDEAAEELMAASSSTLDLKELSPSDGEIPLLEASGLNASTILNDRLTSLEETLGTQSFESQSSELPGVYSVDGTPALVCSNIGFGPQWLPVDIPRELSSPVSFILARGSQFGSRWTLRIRHRAGSLEGALEQVRRGNLFLGLLILAILASSLVLLMVLVLRGQRLARQQMDFVAGVSHEFRTPLAVIGSAAGNLADGVVQTPDQVRTYGDLLRGESRRLTDLVERVLTFASADSRKLEVRPVDVADLVRRVLDDLRRTLDEEGVTVEREIPADLPAAMADPAALETALQNLISNAIKYGEDGHTRNGHWISIEARSETGPRGRPEIGLTVRDRGPGIDPEDRSHIFEPFYRGRRARNAQIPGSGLGLSLVERLMRNLGGRISLEAPVQSGTALTLHLPAFEAEGLR